MDVFDAGVYVYRFEAEVPSEMRTVLWGPLHARELGLPGWEVQDGGETGFVYHKRARASRMGMLSASMIVARRARRAVLTVTLAGFPSDLPAEQRNLETLSLVTEAEIFLTRLSGATVRFVRSATVTLVDQNRPQEEFLERREVAARGDASTGATAGRTVGRRTGAARPDHGTGVWDVF